MTQMKRYVQRICNNIDTVIFLLKRKLWSLFGSSLKETIWTWKGYKITSEFCSWGLHLRFMSELQQLDFEKVTNETDISAIVNIIQHWQNTAHAMEDMYMLQKWIPFVRVIPIYDLIDVDILNPCIDNNQQVL